MRSPTSSSPTWKCIVVPCRLDPKRQRLRAMYCAVSYQEFSLHEGTWNPFGTFLRRHLRRRGVVAMDATTTESQFPAERDAVFTPEAIGAMSDALQGVCAALDIHRPEERAVIATRIIDLAQTGV